MIAVYNRFTAINPHEVKDCKRPATWIINVATNGAIYPTRAASYQTDGLMCKRCASVECERLIAECSNVDRIHFQKITNNRRTITHEVGELISVLRYKLPTAIKWVRKGMVGGFGADADRNAVDGNFAELAETTLRDTLGEDVIERLESLMTFLQTAMYQDIPERKA